VRWRDLLSIATSISEIAVSEPMPARAIHTYLQARADVAY
jgi:hypothetical protein